MVRLLFVIGFALIVLSAAVTLLAPLVLPPPVMTNITEQVDGRRFAAPTLTSVPTPAITSTPTPTLTLEPSALPTTEIGCGPPPGWGIYIIQVGDTLSDLALRTGITVEQIQFANCLDGDLIFADAPLFLPRAPDPRPVVQPTAVPPSQLPTPSTTTISAPSAPASPTASSTPQSATNVATPSSTTLTVTAAPPTNTPIQVSNPSPQPATGLPTAPGVTFIPATDTPGQSPITPASTLAPTASPLPPTVTATAVPPPTPAPTAQVAAEYPVRLDVEDSAVLVVILIQNGKPAPTASMPNQTVIVVPVPPVGTPGPPLKDQFGGGYRATVHADLEAPGFEPVTDGKAYSLDQASISWSWGLKPKNKGNHRIRIAITGEWQPLTGGQARTEEIWSLPLEIKVTERLFTRGQISVSSIICSLIGAVLSAPWFIAQILRLWRQRGSTSRRTRRRRR